MKRSDHQGGASARTSAGNVAGSTTEHCLQCALRFTDPAAYTLHTESEEHANMVLIAGVSDADQDEVSSEFSPLYHCVLCRSYTGKLRFHRDHLMDTMHKKMAQHIRNISFFKERILIGMKWRRDPATAKDYADLKLDLPRYCKVCDIQCNSEITFKNHTESKLHKKYVERVQNCDICNFSYVRFNIYENHLESQLHKTFRVFRDILSIPESEITSTPEKSSLVMPIIPQVPHYFCKSCRITFNNLELFRKHRNISTHRRIHDLIRKMSSQIDESHQIVELYEEVPSSAHYCELCRYWCAISDTETFQTHIVSATHTWSLSYPIRPDLFGT